MREDALYILIGRITRPHNLKGEVRVRFFSSDPGKYGTRKEFYFLKSGRYEPVKVISARPHKEYLLLRFEGCGDRNDAELLRGRELFITRDSLGPVAEGEYYFTDLEGLSVYTSEENLLFGTVSAIFETGANAVLTIRKRKKEDSSAEWNVPFVDDAVTEVDLEQGRVSIRKRFLER